MISGASTPLWRTLLILGRVSNLPTVWSNCLAGWILGGGGSALRGLSLGAGATFLYVGGMFLNDAFDAEFDLQHRPERPIPSGAISAASVWRWGFGWLLAGLLLLGGLGLGTVFLGVFLVGAILLYDAVHKIFAFSPALMALCRVALYLVAASAAQDGVTGLALWSSLVMGGYIVGLSAVARRESGLGSLSYAPCLLLVAPVMLALVVNRGPFFGRGLALSALLLAWVGLALRHLLAGAQRNIGRCVAGLLAGIVWVDWLAVGGGGVANGCAFVVLFVLALLLQRFVPAT